MQPRSQQTSSLDLLGVPETCRAPLTPLTRSYMAALGHFCFLYLLFSVPELDSREQLEALQGLIERIAFDTRLPSHKGGAGQKTTQSLLAELQSAAAQY